MTIDLWHYEVKLRANNLDSQHKKDFSPVEIDTVLNNAIDIWSEQNYSGNNLKQDGFETTQQRIDNLSSLVVKYPEQPMLAVTSSSDGVYEFDLAGLEYDYLHGIRAQAKIVDCSKKVKVKLIQHDDLNNIIDDPFEGPSKGPFPRVIGNFGKSSNTSTESSLYLYTNNLFAVDGLYLEYLKVPKKVCLGGYNDIEGNLTVRAESDLPGKYHTQIIDIAVDELMRILGDPNKFQLTHQKQSINE